MHNLERRIAYAQQRYGLDPVAAAHMVQQHIRAGTEDTLLLPAQRRRLKAHRFDATAERQQRREAAELRRNRRRLWLWDVLTPRTSRVVLKELRTPNTAPAIIGVTPDTEFYGDATPELAQQAADEISAIFGPPLSDFTPPGTSRMRSVRWQGGRKAGKTRAARAAQALRATYAARRGD